jgi:hypothetical protein
MINLSAEQLRPLTEACRDVPGCPHVSTLTRWWRQGIKGVKLETVVVGGRRFTSVEAIRRFISRLSEPRPAGPSPRQEGRGDRAGGPAGPVQAR